MERKIITTADGSKTIQITEWNEQYHSIHGAIQEALHVFIKEGLLFTIESLNNTELKILEFGFGTGLNAYLSALEAERKKLRISYTGLEAFPVSSEEINQLNYTDLMEDHHSIIFNKLHEVKWENDQGISDGFSLKKRKLKFEDFDDEGLYDLIYFDAFGARVQPDLWTEDIFGAAYKSMRDKGVLVTYSSKGSVKRALEGVGFRIERLQGPPGKRHMLRAIKGF